MKSATVRDLRYRFSDIEARLRKGEEVEIRRRKRPIAKLIPIRPPENYPDFAARARRIFGKKIVRRTGVDLMALERGHF